MVRLKVKISEEDQFLFQTSVECSVEATRRDLVLIFNLRQKIRRLKIEIEELTQYGTAKQPGSNEWIEEDPETEEMQKDPTARRNGDLCSPPARATLLKTIAEANACLHKNRVKEGKEATKKELLEAIDLVRGAVLIGYPMGLPEWDPVRLLLENKDDEVDAYGLESYDENEVTLWFAGKSMRIELPLKAFVGKVENTTATIRLMKSNLGAPSREPVIDEETYKGILSWSYKKQEEQKQKLEENQEDEYLDAPWASRHSLKQHLNGTYNIRL